MQKIQLWQMALSLSSHEFRCVFSPGAGRRIKGKSGSRWQNGVKHVVEILQQEHGRANMSDETPNLSSPNMQAEMAMTRTVLAMDRTLLAWVRTSLSLNAFGFTLARFVHDLIRAGSIHGVDAWLPRQLGVTLMVLGIAGIICGSIDYKRSVKRLQFAIQGSGWSASLVVAVLLAVISILLLMSLLSDLNGK